MKTTIFAIIASMLLIISGCFTTVLPILAKEVPDAPPTIQFETPRYKSLTIQDIYLLPTNETTYLLDDTTIKVNVADDTGIQRVDFYLDDCLCFRDDTYPYQWQWTEQHTGQNLTAVAVDISGQTTSISMPVTKIRSHPILAFLLIKLLLSRDSALFGFLSRDHQRFSFLFELLSHLIATDPELEPTLLQKLRMIFHRSDSTTQTFIEYLNNHQLLKLKFKEKFPFISLFICLANQDISFFPFDAALTYAQDKPLLKTFIALTVLSSFVNTINDIAQQDSRIKDGFIWLQEHPWITMISVLLIYQILTSLRSSDASEGTLPENKPPVAHIKASTTAEINEKIDFSAEMSYDEDGTIEAYIWDFGDNLGGHGSITQHTYTKPDTYTITLTVIDDKGVRDSESALIVISDSSSAKEQGPDGPTLLFLLMILLGVSLILIVIIYIFIRRR